MKPFLPSRLVPRNPTDRVQKFAGMLFRKTEEDIYVDLVSQWTDASGVVIGGNEPETVLTNRSEWADVSNFIEEMMYLDMVSYLPDDILTKVDRASMGVSLEARIPMLDHRVIELAWRLPISLKVREGKGKYLLRRLLARYLPEALFERPKMGFGVPIGNWLRGPLREWAEELLDESRLRKEGYLDPARVTECWRAHLAGGRNWQYQLWTVLMFEAWLNQQ